MCRHFPLFTAVLAAACAAMPAHADIVKCLDREGNATLTDLACPAGSRLVQVVTRLPPPPTIAPRLADPPPDARGIARVTLSPAEFAPPRRRPVSRPAVPTTRFIAPVRILATDAATLKAARMALILGEAPEKVAGR
jgi:hypothetical protein